MILAKDKNTNAKTDTQLQIQSARIFKSSFPLKILPESSKVVLEFIILSENTRLNTYILISLT